MADKILSEHTVLLTNRNKMKITGVTKIISYDDKRIIIKTDYGKLTICGKNIVAGEMSTVNQSIDVTGDVDFLQYQTSRGKSESSLGKLFR